MTSYHRDVKFNTVNIAIVYIKNRVVTANLLGLLIVQEIAVFRLESLDKHTWTVTVVHTTLTAHIADSSPALERPLSSSSIYTALEGAISSFSLCLTLVTNGLRASWHLPSTAYFPEAELYGHKNFTIIITSLDTSFIANNNGNKPTS